MAPKCPATNTRSLGGLGMTLMGGVFYKHRMIASYKTLSSRGLRGALNSIQLIKSHLRCYGPLNAPQQIQGPSEASGWHWRVEYSTNIGWQPLTNHCHPGASEGLCICYITQRSFLSKIVDQHSMLNTRSLGGLGKTLTGERPRYDSDGVVDMTEAFVYLRPQQQDPFLSKRFVWQGKASSIFIFI